MHTHHYSLDKTIFKRFMNLVQLFKEAHAVFFMGTVVVRCSVGATQLEKSRQVFFFLFVCFLQRAAKSPTKQHKLERSSVKGWREKKRGIKIECQRESKSMQRKVLLPDTEWGKQMKSQSTQRKREPDWNWDQYIPAGACIFVFALRLSLEYQWRLTAEKQKGDEGGEGGRFQENEWIDRKEPQTDKRKADRGRWGKLITARESEWPQK